MLLLLQPLVLGIFTQYVLAYNFPYEGIQLKDSDVGSNPDIAFGKLPGGIKARCKTFPGDSSWPSIERWNAFNTSLGGALIQSIPPAAACYEGTYNNAAKCTAYRQGARSSLFVEEDPVIPFGQWQLGNPCPLPAVNVTPPEASCNISSFPAYVVNATTVKHIQLAVNFARNNNIRVTIKNTGHDFLGRNTGGGALQVYVHHLKAFEYLPSTRIAEYQGKAARLGAALEQYEVFNYMEQSNITMLAPGSSTVGVLGGYMQGGGFGYISSRFGLMADQVLSLEVVTADGRFVHADPEENEDLFWAIRGGGPSNFGVVTSAVVKAHEPVSVTTSAFNFQTAPVMGNTTTTVQVSNATFWKGVSVYFSHLVRIHDAKGTASNNINTQAPTSRNNRTFSFTGSVTLTGISAAEMKEFILPIVREFNAVGINITNPEPKWFETYPKSAFRPNGPGEGVGNSRFASRLFPRSNFEDTTGEEFNATMAAIRSWVEDGGYGFHSVDYHPTKETAGYPGANSAVNPHLRTAVMHATGFDTSSYGPEVPPAQQIKNHARLNEFANKWRDASPGSGAYMNEADTEEPNFKDSFFGENYERLYDIKKERDPWGVFYAVTAVASDEWVVEGTQGLPTQQGRLCRVDDANS